jgi:hypothetical protein
MKPFVFKKFSMNAELNKNITKTEFEKKYSPTLKGDTAQAWVKFQEHIKTQTPNAVSQTVGPKSSEVKGNGVDAGDPKKPGGKE